MLIDLERGAVPGATSAPHRVDVRGTSGLTYTTLLYQRLDADGVLREHRALPPVLPVVLYNGRRPWTVSVEMIDLVAVGSDLLAPYQPSQRYYLLDAARVADTDLPADNLVSALIALEKARDAARLREALQALSGLLQAQGTTT